VLLLSTDGYALLKEDFADTIAAYGPRTLADNLKLHKVWNLQKYNLLDKIHHLPNNSLALVLANVLLNDFKDKVAYKNFRSFTRRETQFWHLYRRMDDVRKWN